MILVQVLITKSAEKQLMRSPAEVREKAIRWMKSVSRLGLQRVRIIGGAGLHDEPLKGKLEGVRSIRLNRSWRLYYIENESNEIVVTVIRVDKHVY